MMATYATWAAFACMVNVPWAVLWIAVDWMMPATQVFATPAMVLVKPTQQPMEPSAMTEVIAVLEMPAWLASAPRVSPAIAALWMTVAMRAFAWRPRRAAR